MPKKVSDPYNEFYVNYALAMKGWQSVEYNFILVFHDALWCRDRRVASVVYQTVQSFKARIRILELSLHKIFGESSPICGKWSKIATDIHKCYDDRNELAHWIFMHDIDPKDFSLSNIYLSPPFDKPKKQKSGTRNTLSDIDDMSERFQQTSHKLWKFRDDLQNALSLLEKSL